MRLQRRDGEALLDRYFGGAIPEKHQPRLCFHVAEPIRRRVGIGHAGWSWWCRSDRRSCIRIMSGAMMLICSSKVLGTHLVVGPHNQRDSMPLV